MSFSFWAREDNGTANNPALNLTGTPAVELTFVPEGPGGDVILETNGGGADPDTQVEINGATFDFVFEFTGAMPTQKKDGAQQVPDQFEGSDTIVITILDYPTAGETTRFAFMPNESATAAEMDAFGNGAIDVQNLDETPPPTPACFVRGTMIATPHGERPVEDLKAGDRVLTAEGEVVELKWAAYSHFTYAQLLAEPRLCPVCIPRGVLGRQRPYRDLWVSPQHRIVVQGWAAELYLGASAVFIPAKCLVGAPDRPGARWLRGVDYFHLLFDRHEILLSNGLESESFFPGEEALRSIGPEQRVELEALRRHGAARWDRISETALTTVNAREAELIRLDHPRTRRAA